ncbi:hypothetical protein [Xanthobacter sp. VNH20]|uniref:hypothetical protein n=1 Tax=Xanthobacter sp. VNH20 TaxID=3156616 RepID=UPI0032B4EEA1
MSASPRHPAFDQTKADKDASARPPSQDKATAKPAAGPHAKPVLTDPAKTPGTGALPDPHKPNEDATSG